MQLQRPLRTPSRIDAMLPMMNVVLLLLVFLMLLGGLSAKGDVLAAPRSAHAQLLTEAGVRVLYLDAAGVLRDDAGHQPDLTLLSAAGTRTVRLQADAQAPGPVVVAVLQALQAGGVSRVQLAAVGR